MNLSKLLFLATIIATRFASAGVENVVSLTINVRGIESSKGSIMIAVVNDKNDFPAAQRTLIRAKIPAKKGDVSHVFKGLTPGNYAVSVFQDINNSGKLETGGLFGAPAEPYGVSGSPRRFSVPKFDDCAVYVYKDLALDIDLD